MPADDSSEGQPRPATVGDELAGYRIESLVGRGGMGVVYRAHDLALDRPVALKLLAPELAGDVRFRERFLRESRIAASLDHPAIVPIYDAGEVGGQLYIAMRLVEGTDLKRLLAAKGALETETALALLEQVADALDTAHERGLIHRDVKPSNVLVDERGHCYLADFGLSRHLTDQTTDLGAARSLGTVDYVAPEQIRGEELDGRADLYSLGCMLYECLAGQPPYGGSDTAVVFAHLQEEPPELPRLQPVLRKALAKERDDRYQSGRELIAAARRALRPARRRRLLLAPLGAVAALAVVAGVALLARGSHGSTHSSVERRTLPLEADRLNLIDSRTRHVVGGVPARRHNVTDVAFLGRSAWFSVPEDSRLLRVDPRTRSVSKVVRLPWMPTDRIAAGGGLVWVREARNLGTLVLGIDGGSGRIVRHFDIGGSSIGISYGAGSLWLVGGGDIVRVDPRSGRVLHHFPAGADLILYADGAVWATSNDGSVWKIDPVGNRITAHTKLHPFVSDLAVGDGALWVAVVGENKVYRLSEDDLAVEQATPAGPDPERISAGDGAVWVANPSARALSRVAERSGARTQLATGAEPSTVRFHGGVVWVPAVHGLPPLPPIAGEQLRISTPYRFFNTDPASRVFPMDEQLTVATCARLLTYGPQGLRPEVAAEMPSVSRDGRTYTFRVRPGFRFSPPSNERVTAATFRYTIERTLSPHSQASYLAPEIVGLDAFESGRTKHISGITARGSRLSITLVRPAGDLPARLALTVFCPVPLSTPLDPARVKGPIASDGPYYFSSAEGDRFVLLRNPNYAGGRSRRAARIVITDDVPTSKAVALVDNGQLDYLPEDFQGGNSLLGPLGELAPLDGPGSPAARTGAQRLYFHTQPMVDTVVFNSKRPLFRNVRMRRAVEYALDRPAMAHAFFDAPAEGLVPVPGYNRAGVYSLTGPDLRTARKLAGTKHRNAVLLLPCDFGASGAAGILRSNLARIGITVRIDQFGSCSPTTIPRRFRTADMIIGTSLQCGPCERDPALFFTGVLHHGLWGGPLPPGPWDAPAFTKRLDRAAELRGRARVAAFTRLEDELARDAPFAIYGSFLYGEYFGRRVGCRHFSAFSQGVDLGSLCERAA